MCHQAVTVRTHDYAVVLITANYDFHRLYLYILNFWANARKKYCPPNIAGYG